MLSIYVHASKYSKNLPLFLASKFAILQYTDKKIMMGERGNSVSAQGPESAQDLEPHFGTFLVGNGASVSCARESASLAKSCHARVSASKDSGHQCFCPGSRNKILGLIC